MTFGSSPVGIKSRQERSYVKARQEFLETVLAVLAVEPSAVHYQQIDTLIDGFLWSADTYAIVREAAERVYVAINKEMPPWTKYEKTNERRSQK